MASTKILNKKTRKSIERMAALGDESARKKIILDDALRGIATDYHLKNRLKIALEFIERCGLTKNFQEFKYMKRSDE